MAKIFSSIPVRVQPFFWLLAFLIGWLSTFDVVKTLIWVVIIFISVLIHEFGHALTAKFFGQRVRIELAGLGGVTRHTGIKLPWWKELIIVINGPLAGFSLSVVSFYLLSTVPQSDMLVYAFTVTYVVNIVWTLINLIPMLPLDGGRILSILMEAAFGLKGVKIALFLSFIIGGAAGFYFFLVGQLLGGIVFLMLTADNFRSWRTSLTITEHDRDQEVMSKFDEAERYYQYGDKLHALLLFKAIRDKTKAGMIFISASERLARIYHEMGDNQLAFDVLFPIKNKLSGNDLRFLHELAFLNGSHDDAISIGNQIFQNEPNYQTAVQNALSHAIKTEEQPAVGWLQSAIREGLPNIKEIVAKSEFDNIRKGKLFNDFVQRLASNQ